MNKINNKNNKNNKIMKKKQLNNIKKYNKNIIKNK